MKCIATRQPVPCYWMLAFATHLLLYSGCWRGDAPNQIADISRPIIASELVGELWAKCLSDATFDLTKGRWLVVILHRDCNHCLDLFRANLDGRRDFGELNVAVFVAGDGDWPAYVGFPRMSGNSDFTVVWPNAQEPFVASPAVFLLADGVVRLGGDGEGAERVLNRILPPGSAPAEE